MRLSLWRASSTPLHGAWSVTHNSTQVKHQSTDSSGFYSATSSFRRFILGLLNNGGWTVDFQTEVYKIPDGTQSNDGARKYCLPQVVHVMANILNSFTTMWQIIWYSMKLIFLDFLNNILDLLQSMCIIIIYCFKSPRYKEHTLIRWGEGHNSLGSADNSS